MIRGMLPSGIFLDGIRTSTWATAAVFAVLCAYRQDWKVMGYCAVWLTGFEVAYQLTALVMGTNMFPLAAPVLMVPGLIIVPIATFRYGVKPSLPTMGLVAAVWIVWIALGFHANQHERPSVFDPLTEALNEGAKTLWAAAYLLPLLVTSRRGEPHDEQAVATN